MLRLLSLKKTPIEGAWRGTPIVSVEGNSSTAGERPYIAVLEAEAISLIDGRKLPLLGPETIDGF